MTSLSVKLCLGLLLFGTAANQGVHAAELLPAAAMCMADDDLSAAKAEAKDLLENRTEEGSAPGCYTAESRETFSLAIEAATTKAEVDAAVKAYKASVLGVQLSTEGDEHWYYIVSGPSVDYCKDAVIYDLTFKSGEQLKWNDKSVDALCMWKFVDGGNGKVLLVNRKTGRYMKNPGSNGSKVVSEKSKAYATKLSLVTLGEQRAFLIRESTAKQPVHADKNGTVVAWRTVTLNTASVWHFDPVSEEDLSGADGGNDNWELVWSDEFNTDGPVDTENWTFEQGFVRNSEPQWYQPGNAECKDGNLVITARKERVENPNYEAGSSDWRKNRQYAEYTSSSIISMHKRDLKYGRMEVRAKIPVSSGAWPAIWTKGYPEINGPWPACGEVDILEFYDKSIFANVAWSNATGGSQWRTVKTPYTHFTGMDQEWAEKYHTWRMDWDSLSIRLYLDDELLNVTALSRTVQPVGDFCLSAEPFKNPMFILLNLALRTPDGIDESALPISYHVDYVRFYQKKGASTPDAIESVSREDDTWLVNLPGNPYVDANAFDGVARVCVYDLSGALVHTGNTSRSQTVYSLSGLPKGMYVVHASDGKHNRSGKIAIN